jgi:pentatricopeptide repeat protein
MKIFQIFSRFQPVKKKRLKVAFFSNFNLIPAKPLPEISPQQHAKQVSLLLEKILSNFDASDTKSSEIIMRIADKLMDFDASAWSELNLNIWENFLDSLRKIGNSTEIAEKLINMRTNRLNLKGPEIQTLKVLSESVEFNSISDLDQWIRKLQLMGAFIIEEELAYKLLCKAIKELDQSLHLATVEYFVDSSYIDICFDNFMKYVARYINEYPVETKYMEDKQLPKVRFKSLIRKLSRLIAFKYSDQISLSFFEYYSEIFEAETYSTAAHHIQFIEQVGLKPDSLILMRLIGKLELQNAKQLLQMAEERNINCSRAIYSYCLENISNKRFEHAYEIFQYSTATSKKYLFCQTESSVLIDCLLQYICYHGTRNTIAVFLDDMKQNNYLPKLETLSVVIGQLCQVGMPDIAKAIFQDFRLKVDENNIYQELVHISKAYLASNQITECILLVTSLEEQGFRIGKRVRIYILRALIKSNQLDRAQNWFNLSKSYQDIEMANALLQGFVDAGLNEKVDSLLKYMQNSKLKLSDQTFGILIKGYLQAGDGKGAFRLLKKMKKHHKIVGDRIYASFLQYFVNTAKWDIVDLLFKEMGMKSIGDQCASLMIRSYAVRNDVKSSLNLVENLSSDTHPESFRDIVIMLLRINEFILAKSFLDKMLSGQINAQFSYSIIEFIRYFARKGQLEEAEKYLKLYLQLFPPHSRAFNVLVRSVSYNKLHISKALKYWDQMVQLKVPLNVEAYNSIIAAHSDLGLYAEAENFFNQFLQTGQKINIPMYCTMIALYGKRGMVGKMEHLYFSVSQDISLGPSAYSASTLMNSLMTGYSYCGQWEKVFAIWNLLRSSVSSQAPLKQQMENFSDTFHILHSNIGTKLFGVNSVTVCIVLDSLGLARKLNHLRTVWEEINSIKMSLTLNNYISYIEGLLRCGEHQEAIDTIVNLPKGVQPDTKLLRNALNLLPNSLRLDAYKLFIQKYPTVPLTYSMKDFKNPNSIVRPIQHGLSSNQLKSQMKLKNGILVLPGQQFHIDIPE